MTGTTSEGRMRQVLNRGHRVRLTGGVYTDNDDREDGGEVVEEWPADDNRSGAAAHTRFWFRDYLF